MRTNNSTGTLRTLAGFLLLSGTFACDASVLDSASRADLIVVGRVTTRIESSTNLSFDLNVDRVLKGDQSSSTLHICHDWHSSGLSGNSIQIQTGTFYGIWFLISEAPGSWDALPITKDGFIFSLFLSASEQPASPYLYPPGTAYLDALVYEIGAGFEKFPGTAQSMLLPVSITGTAMDTIIARAGCCPISLCALTRIVVLYLTRERP